jgi:hypothetical protein
MDNLPNVHEEKCLCHSYVDPNTIHESLKSEEETEKLLRWLSGDRSIPGISSSVDCQMCRLHRADVSLSLLQDIQISCHLYLHRNEAKANDEIKIQTKFSGKQETRSDASTGKAGTRLLVAKKEFNASTNSSPTLSSSSSTKPMRRIRPAPTSKKSGNLDTVSTSFQLNQSLELSSTDWPSLSSSKTSTNISKTSFRPFRSNEKIMEQHQKGKGQVVMSLDGKQEHDSEKDLGTSSVACESCKSGDSIVIPPNNASSSSIRDARSLNKSQTTNVSPEFSPNKQRSYNSHQESVVSLHPKSTLSEVRCQDDSSLKTEPSGNLITSTSFPQAPTCISRVEVKIVDEGYLENLSKVYSTLILNNLVPSTPFELQLLLSLLSVQETTTQKNEKSPSRHIFVSPEACRKFAILSFITLKSFLKNLPLFILSAFLAHPKICALLPDLTTELTVHMHHRQSSLVEAEIILGGSGVQPIFTIPFDKSRDSSHNYRSNEEKEAYKNREESRDAFLYQLRFFQNVRGRVLNSSELESTITKLRENARSVIQGIHNSNMHWFAQFFCDLLLQLGLVPMEETDKDLLKITDQDKLQRLHKRFSSKVVPSHGRTLKIVSNDKRHTSVEGEAHQLFPGHQEFFYLFLCGAESYSFGMHCKCRLIARIKSLEGISESKSFQERLMKLQLLGKFLGVLVFRPTWHSQAVSSVVCLPSNEEIDIWISTTENPSSWMNFLDVAWEQNRIIGTVPWILAILRMGKWDPISLHSSWFRSTIEKLIQLRNCIRVAPSSSLLFVDFTIEFFLHEVIGFRQCHDYAELQVPIDSNSPREFTFDSMELDLSQSILFQNVPHLEDFWSMLLSSSAPKIHSSVAPRKLRPSAILLESKNVPSSKNDLERPQISAVHRNPSESLLDRKSVVLGKLADLFFHQHRELKEICEFVADRACKATLVELKDFISNEYLKNEGIMKNSRQTAESRLELEQTILSGSLLHFKETLSSKLHLIIKTLCVETRSPKIFDIAIQLTMDSALKVSKSKIHSLVNSEVQRHFVLQDLAPTRAENLE